MGLVLPSEEQAELEKVPQPCTLMSSPGDLDAREGLGITTLPSFRREDL